MLIHLALPTFYPSLFKDMPEHLVNESPLQSENIALHGVENTRTWKWRWDQMWALCWTMKVRGVFWFFFFMFVFVLFFYLLLHWDLLNILLYSLCYTHTAFQLRLLVPCEKLRERLPFYVKFSSWIFLGKFLWFYLGIFLKDFPIKILFLLGYYSC